MLPTFRRFTGLSDASVETDGAKMYAAWTRSAIIFGIKTYMPYLMSIIIKLGSVGLFSVNRHLNCDYWRFLGDAFIVWRWPEQVETNL